MTILCKDLTLEQINAALLRIQRSIQTSNNNFQDNVEKAVANVTISGKTTIQKYDDSRLMAIVNELNQKYNSLSEEQSSIRSKIINLETILANVALDYDIESNELTYSLGDYSNSVVLRDTTYTFSYDDETGAFTIVDDFTGETVFSEVFNDTTYTFSFENGILTIHNNLLDTDQTFNFDARYYTESEIQSLILDKIPTQASASNQLADKDFVNSSISTSTATFRGTVTTTQALAALTGDLNDYAFLQNIDPVTGQTISYDRYKWVESGGDYGHWKYEYTLNNSSFTSDQWAAINSGITCQIVTDLLDGCYTGCSSQVAKSTSNEWKSILATTCDCSSAVDADCIYYNTNIQANQACGSLKAKCYCVDGKGYATFAKTNIAASDLGLTAGCCYSLTCILNQIMVCYGSASGTYTFQYANAQNPIICETLGYAYCGIFTKEDSFNPIAYKWNMTRWSVSFNNGLRFNVSAYSTANAGIACWSVANNARAWSVLRNQATSGTCHIVLTNGKTEGYTSLYVSNGCSLTFDPSTGTLAADNFSGAIDETKYPGACCTGTLVPSDLNDYQKKNIPTGIRINNTSNLTCVDTILSCFNNTIQKQAYRKSWTSTHCRYIYLANIAVSSGSVASASYTLYLFSTIYNACPTKSYSIGTIQIDISSGSDANGFSIRGNTDVKLDCTTANYPRIIVTKDTTNNIYRLYLDTNYAYLSFDIQRNRGYGTNAWGDFSACASYVGTEVFNSSTSPDEIKYIGGLVSISNKAAVDEPTPVLLCTGATSVGKSTSCELTFNTCTGDLSANKFIGSNQYHGVLGSASGSTVKYATIEIDGTSYQYFETCINFSIYNSVFHAVSQVCDNEIRGLANVWYEGDNCYGIKCIGYSTCKANNTCIYVAYSGYRFVNVSSSARIKSITQNGTTEPANVCWIAPSAGIPLSQRAVGSAGVDRTKKTDNVDYPVLLAPNCNTTQNGCVYVAEGITYNPSSGYLTSKAIQTGWYKTLACAVEFTPTAQADMWLLVGSFKASTNGNNNTLNITLTTSGSGMVSSVDILIRNDNANNPFIRVYKGCNYNGCGIQAISVSRSGSVWDCSLYVWALVRTYGTSKFTAYLFRNQIPNSWATSLTYCSGGRTGTIMFTGACNTTGSGMQISNVLYVGQPTATTSSAAGGSGSIWGSGYSELYGATPYIDMHRNCACADYSVRLINSETGRFDILLNNSTGCTASTQSATFLFCSNGTLLVPQFIYGNNGRVLNLLFEKPDNSGYPVYRLLYEITDWYNASSGITGKGINGTFTSIRTAGYLSSGQTSVSAFVSYGRGSTDIACCQTSVANLTWAALGFASSSNIPYILKDTTNNKYYLAVRFLGSQHCEIFNGIACSGTNTANLLTCNICATDAGGTLPTGWQIVTTGARRNCANLVYAGCTTSNGGLPLLMGGATENAWTCIYTNCANLRGNPGTGRIISCQSRVNDYIIISCAESVTTGTLNTDQPGILLDKNLKGRMVQINGIAGSDKGLLLSTCGDINGTTYCTLGLEIGSGNCNRGFYHCKNGTFKWIQYWDGNDTETHCCNVSFLCPVTASSTVSGTFAQFCNTNRLGSVYSSNTYNTGYYLLAQICDGGGTGNHDIYLGGYLDSFAVPRMTWKGVIRANKCTLSFACFFVNNSYAGSCLVATREIDTTTCKLILRIYGKVSANYQRFNTTVTYAAIGDCNNRVSPYHSCVTLPGTYVTSLTGTTITTTQNIGSVSSDWYCTIPVSRTCNFPATSTSYILLGCYQPQNNAYANELDLGFAIGGGNLVEKVKLNLMLVNGSCCSTGFRQNKIQVKNADYQTGCFGVRCIAFTTSGNSWNCCIGIWAVVCNSASAACSWSFGLLRDKIDDRFSTCMSCTSTAPTFVCKVEIPSGRKNFTFDNSWYSCFCEIQTPTVCACRFTLLPRTACSKCYILLGSYTPTLLYSNELDLTLNVGDAANSSVNIKALLTTGCFADFEKNNIQIKTSSIDRTHAFVDSVIFSTMGTCWSCPISVYALVCTSTNVDLSLYTNVATCNFVSCLCGTTALPPAPQNYCVPIYCNNSYYNNALGTWTNPTCVRHYNTDHCCTMTAIIPLSCLPSSGTISYCLGFSNHFAASGNTPAHDCLTSIFIDLSLTNYWNNASMIKFCVSNGYCYITPYKVSLVCSSSSVPTGLHINFAICCSLECFDLYTSYCTLINKTPGSCLSSLPSPVIPTISNGELAGSLINARVYAGSEGAVAISGLNASCIQTRSLAVTSSVKSKKCIEPLLENALGILKDTNIVRYKYNDESLDEPKHVGIIAEFTDSIMSGSRKDHFNVSDSVGLLIDAVKDIEASLSLWQRLKIKIYRKFIKSKKDKVFIKKISKCTNK